METVTIHPAEAYLRNEQNPTSLYVRIGGQRRRLFINRDENLIGIIAPRKRKRGHIFTDWASIEKIYYPSHDQEANTDRKLILKYQKLARLATHNRRCGFGKVPLREPHHYRYTHRRQVYRACHNRKILRNGRNVPLQTGNEEQKKFFHMPL